MTPSTWIVVYVPSYEDEPPAYYLDPRQAATPPKGSEPWPDEWVSILERATHYAERDEALAVARYLRPEPWESLTEYTVREMTSDGSLVDETPARTRAFKAYDDLDTEARDALKEALRGW